MALCICENKEKQTQENAPMTFVSLLQRPDLRILCSILRRWGFFSLFMYSFTGQSQNQLVSGVVTDSETGMALPFASVFVNNTTEGVSTDQEGKFSLHINLVGPALVVVSYVGYATQTKMIESSPLNTLVENFSLEPLQHQLKEIELVSGRDKKWNKQLVEFEQEFIGDPKDSIVKKTKILNPWVVNFDEGKQPKRGKYLAAHTTQPLEIDNQALGYKLSYLLEDFLLTKNGYKYLGKAQFTEKDTTVDEVRRTWQLNRQLAYQGSDVHFLKSVLNRTTSSQGFKIFEMFSANSPQNWSDGFLTELGKSILPIPADSIVVLESKRGTYQLVYRGKMEVHYSKEVSRNNYYRDVYYPVSWIEFMGDTLEINANGVPVNREHLIVSGEMSEERMAYMLPADYSEDDNTVGRFLKRAEAVKLNSLREKLYLATDKPYYYPGEFIWFSGRMLYKNSSIKDTLSKVLYVDLIRTDIKLIIQSTTLPLENGMASGAFQLPGNLNPGDYCIRAYTNWMRNFGDLDFTHLPVPVIGIFSRPISENPVDVANDTGISVNISLNKSAYSHREKIDMKISLTDEEGNARKGDMTVSITDTLQVPSLGDLPSLVEAAAWTQLPMKYPKKAADEYPIEYGLSIGGQFVNDKGAAEQVFVSVVQGDWEDYTIINTDSAGRLWVSGFQFTDSVKISIAAIDPKTNGAYGTIALNEKTKPVVSKSLPVLPLPVTRQRTPQREYNLNFREDYTLLPEIEIEGAKIKKSLEDTFGYPEGDQVVSGDRLRSLSDIPLGRIIGITVAGASPDGTRILPPRIATQPPGLIIDGAWFSMGDLGSLKDNLQNIYGYEIEKIDVYKSSRGAFGFSGAGGVIMVKTKGVSNYGIRKVEQYFDKSSYQHYTLNGYGTQLSFPSPDYDVAKDSHSDPDFRSTLYWNPNIETDENGLATFSFYSGDLDAVYRVLVEGMTEDETPFCQIKYLKVGQ